MLLPMSDRLQWESFEFYFFRLSNGLFVVCPDEHACSVSAGCLVLFLIISARCVCFFFSVLFSGELSDMPQRLREREHASNIAVSA